MRAEIVVSSPVVESARVMMMAGRQHAPMTSAMRRVLLESKS